MTSSNQRHEYFLASSVLWHTQPLFYLPGWAGDSVLTPHSELQPNPASLPATIHLPLYLPTRSSPFSVSQEQISFSMSTANPFWCCLCPSKNTVLHHSSIGFNPLPKPPSFALLWRSKSPLIPFLGSSTLLPLWGQHLWTHCCVISADYYLFIALPSLVFLQCSR